MARRKSAPSSPDAPVADYRYPDKRKHIPPAGLAAQGRVAEVPKARYAYDPHLPPVLRFDETGQADRLPELLETARQRPLTADEARLLADALRVHQPWLEWAGKRERAWFEADPVALHIHERVSAQAILKLAQQQPLQRSLFADPELNYRQAVQFYQYDVDWANRLILGDSLTVMHSLARREDLAGKVQMIYVDPPYGIKFASNFQPLVRERSVKDKAEDLTREPEQVKAYRDTWILGVHSYLAYLRDRLIVARELLADSGSIFVQISDENLHRVRLVMDEVFGPSNFISGIATLKTSGKASEYLDPVFDTVLWYAKDRSSLKYRQLFSWKELGSEGTTQYIWAISLDEEDRRLSSEELRDQGSLPEGYLVFAADNLTSQSASQTTLYEYDYQGKKFGPGKGGWKTNEAGMRRLAGAGRLKVIGNSLMMTPLKILIICRSDNTFTKNN